MINNVVTAPETPWLVKANDTETRQLEWMDPSYVIQSETAAPLPASKRTYVKWEDAYDPMSSTTHLVKKNVTKILGIDGGGIRVQLTLVWLAKLEKELETPLGKIFDIVAGTSVGSMIAEGLVIPSKKDPREPEYTAQFFHEEIPSMVNEVFPSSISSTVKEDVRLGTDQPFFSDEGLDKIGKKYVGDTLVKDALKEVVVPVYKPGKLPLTLFVTRTNAQKHSHFADLTMLELAKMSSAAIPYLPTQYFKGARYNDGGYGANNPILGAIAAAQGNNSDKVVCSFGTGISPTEYEADPKCGEGIFSIWPSLLGMAMNAAQQGINSTAQQLLGKNYHRVERTLLKSISLDDPSPANMEYLKEQALAWFDEPGNDEIWRTMRQKLEPTESSE
jgi:uncharacterized protein